MRSALYDMAVVHHRLHPQPHRLRRGVTMLWLELDELDLLARRLRLFSVGRRNLVSFHAEDHGAGANDPGDLRAWLESQLVLAGIAPPGGSIALLCMPRLAGGAFNPISTWFCHRPDGTLGALLYEVRNTFGGRHAYAVGVDSDGPHLRHDAEKRFHVSPFMPMRMGYRFDLIRPDGDAPDARLTLSIAGGDGERTLIRAVMTGRRQPLTDRALLRHGLRRPMQGLAVLGGIHLEAARLWRKGARFHPNPAPPASPVTQAFPGAFPGPFHG